MNSNLKYTSRWISLAVSFWCCGLAVHGQTPAVVAPDTVRLTVGKQPVSKADTGQLAKKAQRKAILNQTLGLQPILPENRPTVAFLRAIVPSMGQYTNGQYIKMGVVLGAATGGVLAIAANRSRFRYYKTILRAEENKGVTTLSFQPAKGIFDGGLHIAAKPNGNTLSIAPDRLVTVAEQYRRWRDLSVIGFAVGYFLSGVEAYVAAHLQSFDVDDKISMHVKPTFQLPNQPVGMGVSVTLSLK